MNLQKLEELFGTEPAKLYMFNDSVPTDIDPVAHITEIFAVAAETNLINCVVTQIFGNWLVYTKESEITDDNFVLVCDFPLPQPEVESQEPEGEVNAS